MSLLARPAALLRNFAAVRSIATSSFVRAAGTYFSVRPIFRTPFSSFCRLWRFHTGMAGRVGTAEALGQVSTGGRMCGLQLVPITFGIVALGDKQAWEECVWRPCNGEI